MCIYPLKEDHPNFTDSKDDSGMYVCTACGHALFDASKKFDAGCGFPSFWMHRETGVKLNPLSTYGRERIQLLCNNCQQHLGHLFANRYTPTGIRYCINSSAIKLVE